ncbi:glycosyltransferase family 2 protein [Vibrio cyclitrophicus]
MLTIFVPSYNHADYITKTLDEILKINIPNKRVYVIDDCSSDDSVSVILNYIKQHDTKHEIDFYCKEKNKGVVDSLNVFLENCTTDYVYLMSSDDIVVPDSVLELFEIINNNENLQYVIGGASNLTADGLETPVYNVQHDLFFSLSDSDRFEELYLNSPSPILSQGTIIRKEALISIGGWDKDIIADDYSMFLRLLVLYPSNGNDFLFLPDIVCVKYRHHGENSYKKTLRQFLMTTQVLRKYSPKKIKNEALARKFAYYLAVSIKRANFKSAIGIFKNSSFNEIILGLYYFVLLIVTRLVNKCIR